MASCNSASTPVDTKSKLSSSSGSPYEDPSLFRSLAGALQYLTFTTRYFLCCSADMPSYAYSDNKSYIRVLHVPSKYQMVDIFRKGLPQILFTDFRDSLSVRPPPATSAGVY
ncbi:hypothetical protein LIER_28892 [Lithospermum erythrorhizon]|uniref:Uncharacterized protein n=1 Tax=Lithospermum erythrorhizon TaxID=34254 RepID=A0AAV3RJ48_LITER